MLGFLKKFKELPGETFLCFAFFTAVPKNIPKNGPKMIQSSNNAYLVVTFRIKSPLKVFITGPTDLVWAKQ